MTPLVCAHMSGCPGIFARLPGNFAIPSHVMFNVAPGSVRDRYYVLNESVSHVVSELSSSYNRMNSLNIQE